MVSCIRNNYIPAVTVPLAFLSILFGTLILALNGRLHRCLQIPVIIVLELEGNQYAVIGLLGVRLLLLLYFFYPRSPYFLGFCPETSNYLILISCFFSDPQSLNYVSYIALSVTSIIFGLFLTRLSYEHQISLYDKADRLEDNQE